MFCPAVVEMLRNYGVGMSHSGIILYASEAVSCLSHSHASNKALFSAAAAEAVLASLVADTKLSEFDRSYPNEALQKLRGL